MNSNPLDDDAGRSDPKSSTVAPNAAAADEQDMHWQAENVRADSVISGASDGFSVEQ